ncbi:MAG: 2-C-methyl-D-erythritol 4-phosphate cytidylyltransferase [Candidatus Dactylopiibacterium sp.]|nr:2-C-methyl-D-erythritol 4-phosphate cytidylyltransferase [Candidatus Dactylopiibacterium sp.]
MSRHFAIVPAAGSGSRMGAGRPKQYLELAGRPLIWHALAALAGARRIACVCVVLSPEDDWWPRFDWAPLAARLRVLRVGGATRAQTVGNALEALAADVAPEDWMLVHDAARACLTTAQVDALIDALADDAVGGLLAQPVADTLKRGDAASRVAQTVPREAMWQAQTPQMFRHGVLRRALAEAPHVTDEAGAIESLGLAPRLVAAEAPNFKVTFPQDLALAELILRARGER